jgi:hypothetical protein
MIRTENVELTPPIVNLEDHFSMSKQLVNNARRKLQSVGAG